MKKIAMHPLSKLFYFCFYLFPQLLFAQSTSVDTIKSIDKLPIVKQSLFDHLYTLECVPKVVIDTDVKQLIKKKYSEPYQAANITVLANTKDSLLYLSGRIRARGNMRKKVGFFPPVKLDFRKSDLDSLGYSKLDDIKMVFPSEDNSIKQELLLK